jgi:multiple sugar transport system ATP-binding protein
MPRVEFRSISKIYPDGTRAVIDLDLTVEDGEFLCVLGPSGCGKSSTLRMLAGLESISAGDLLLNGTRINDVPPQARDMAMVFENYALYPHLRAFDNIAMPLAARRLPREDIRARVDRVAQTLRISEHLDKRPQQLSGGQRQRVALARAIVRTPKMFLMDEPLGHLEAYLRAQLRAEIRRLHERLRATTFYITHDQEEAAAVSDRIAVMNNGRIQQFGTLLDLLDRPANRFVAEFIGSLPINIFDVSLSDDGAGVTIGLATLPVRPPEAARLRERPRGLTFGIRPEDVSLTEENDAATLPGRAMVLEPQGDRTVMIADTPAGQVSAVVPSHDAPPAGCSVRLSFAPGRGHFFAATGESVLNGVGGAG